MTKNEFLAKLKEALENDLDVRVVQDNVVYYRSYIDGEVSKGRSEEEVLDELGDPWVIAQSIINMEEQRSSADVEEGEGRRNGGYRSGETGGQSYSDTKIRTYAVDSWWKKLILVLGVIGIVLIVLAVIGGLISLIMPIVIPVLLVVLLVRLLQQMRR